MKKKDSQKNMYAHSEKKVELLQKYLEIYLNVLSNTFVKRINLFDLFCGPGIYENEGIGSPFIMLQEIKKASTINNKKAIEYNCLFNDNDREVIEVLKRNVKSKIDHCYAKINYSCQDYKDVIRATILSMQELLNSEKAFAFIDPYQYKDISISEIESMLCTKKTEILLFLPTQFMFRFESNGTPKSLKRFIEELVPMEEWPKSNTGIDFIQSLKEQFKNHLGNDYYVDTFIIQREVNQYFSLFFFTSNILGFEKMLEAKWKIDKDEGRGWIYEHSYNLFSGNKSSITQKFENELKEYLSRSRTNKEVYEFTLHNGHLPKHTNEVLKAWQNEGILSVLKSDGEQTIKGSFYLNYKDWRDHPGKVTIQTKLQ